MILALDYGSRYVGVAITDSEGKIPLRHSVIDQKQANALDRVCEIVESEKVDVVVVGWPVSLSGEETGQAQATRIFIDKLKTILPKGVKIETVDERFTSKEAERIVLAEGGKKEDAHAEAARLVLESYISGSML